MATNISTCFKTNPEKHKISCYLCVIFTYYYICWSVAFRSSKQGLQLCTKDNLFPKQLKNAYFEFNQIGYFKLLAQTTETVSKARNKTHPSRRTKPNKRAEEKGA